MPLKADGQPCFEWTAESDAWLRRLWAVGISTARIGAQMGTTKGSIISRSRRIGLPGRGSPLHCPNMELQAEVRSALKRGVSPTMFANNAGRSKTHIWRIAQQMRQQEGVVIPRLRRAPGDIPSISRIQPSHWLASDPTDTDTPAVTPAPVPDSAEVDPGVVAPPPDVEAAGECVHPGSTALLPPEDVALPPLRGPRCMFPMWGTGRTIFRGGEPWLCGAPRERGVYCWDHAARCYTRQRVRGAAE